MVHFISALRLFSNTEYLNYYLNPFLEPIKLRSILLRCIMGCCCLLSFNNLIIWVKNRQQTNVDFGVPVVDLWLDYFERWLYNCVFISLFVYMINHMLLIWIKNMPFYIYICINLIVVQLNLCCLSSVNY